MTDFQDFYINVVRLEKATVNGAQISSLCPIKDHRKKNQCFSANFDTGQCKCFKGCFDGNAYTLAQHLNIDKPEQWLTNKTHISEEITPPIIKEKNIMNTEEVKSDNYLNTVNALHGKMMKYLTNGKNDAFPKKILKEEKVGFDGKRLVFPYFNNDMSEVVGIKYHKPKPHSTKGFKCTWYLGWHLKKYDTKKPLYICEGEKDALFMKSLNFQVVSSSNGASSLPDDMAGITKFECIFIYDNDEAGIDGAKKHGRALKLKNKDMIVKVAKWSIDLPDGYDVFDDFKRSMSEDMYGLDELDKAIINAKQIELNLPKKLGAFTVMTGKEASMNKAKETEWLIEHILPKEFNSCLAGTTGAKKSMWAIQLAMALANGDKNFCGNKILTSGIKVLYVDTEIGNTELHRRYKKIQGNMDWRGDDNIFLLSKSGIHLDIWKDVHEAISYVNPELIIFDSLYNTTKIGDFSKSSQMSKVTNELTKFKELYGVTILTIAHFNKGQHDQGLSIDRMQGSAVLQNWVEFQMLMVSTNVSDFNLWTVAKARGVRHDQSVIGLKWDDFWFNTIGVVEDYRPFLIADEKKLKWQSILEDCAKRFDTKDWMNVFNQKTTLSERTGMQWLKECSDSPMVNKLSHGLYEKDLRLINESNIDE